MGLVAGQSSTDGGAGHHVAAPGGAGATKKVLVPLA